MSRRLATFLRDALDDPGLMAAHDPGVGAVRVMAAAAVQCAVRAAFVGVVFVGLHLVAEALA